MAKKKAARPQRPPTVAERVGELLHAELRARLDAPTQNRDDEQAGFETLIPSDQQANVIAILVSDNTPSKAYRTLLIIQLAYQLSTETPIDLTRQQPGGRGVAGRLHAMLRAAHIVSPIDVYQNIGKGSGTLVSGNFAPSDNLLRWASEADRTNSQIEAIFRYVCTRIATTSRPILAMPDIDTSKLTFANVMAVFNAMLAEQSGGAHEQFIVAALLHAKVEQTNPTQSVSTKNITASDKSNGAAADVQIKTGTRVVEGFEVTANPWLDKLGDAGTKIRANDLSRLHIIAQVNDTIDIVLRDLLTRSDDLSVQNILAFVASLVAELTKAFRASALKRLHELLERHQPDIAKVNGYVERLHSHGLTVPKS